jgi:hypothetical protein
LVALDYGNGTGTAYAGLQMLEGAMPREAITTCAVTVNASDRRDAVLRGEVDATGCRSRGSRSPRRRAAASYRPRFFTAPGSPIGP